MMALGLGLGLPFGGNAGGPATPAFNPSAIHFDWQQSKFYTGSALTSAGGALADTSKLTVSFILWGVPATAAMNTGFVQETLENADFVSAKEQAGDTSEDLAGQNTALDNAGGIGTLRFNFANIDKTAHVQATAAPSLNPPPARATPTVITYSLDGSVAGATKFAAAINGVEVVSGASQPDGLGVPFLAGISNPRGWNMFNYTQLDTGLISGNITEVWLSFDTAIVDSSNHFVAGSLAKFCDPVTGYPVSLGVNGELPYGASHVHMYFTGPAATFATNKATGSQAVTNTFTTQGLYDAQYKPGSGGVVGPALMLSYGENFATSGTLAAGNHATIRTGLPTLAGDIFVQALYLDNSAAAVDHVITMVTAGYTLLGYRVSAWDASTFAVYAKTAAADGEDDSVTWNWTYASANRSGQWVTFIVRNGVIDASAISAAATSDSTTFTAPSVTATGSADLLLALFNTYNTDAVNTLAVPTGFSREYTSRTGSQLNINSKRLAASGATGAITTTSTGADSGTSFSICFK